VVKGKRMGEEEKEREEKGGEEKEGREWRGEVGKKKVSGLPTNDQ